jgi:GT2 family glycosyltransferase
VAGVDVLIPTINRVESLVLTLAGVAAQDHTDLHVIVADQSDEPACGSRVVQTLRRIIEARGGSVEWHHRPQVHGVAEQRHLLLQHARSDAVLYLDDDVFMEPWVVSRLLAVLKDERCGFVGAFPAGLSHLEDIRPDQQILELWDGRVEAETVEPDSPAWERFHLHRAANLYHAAQRLSRGETCVYKVAWVASCVLYDRAKLCAVGGFAFWSRLPRWHSGEEVLVQNLLMRRWGGCGIVPSGTYYSQVDTTVLNGAGTVDGHALELLDEMVDRYAPSAG